jgi:hypothetical protein
MGAMADWAWVLVVGALPLILPVGLGAGVCGFCGAGRLPERRLGFSAGACVSLAGLPG